LLALQETLKVGVGCDQYFEFISLLQWKRNGLDRVDLKAISCFLSRFSFFWPKKILLMSKLFLSLKIWSQKKNWKYSFTIERLSFHCIKEKVEEEFSDIQRYDAHEERLDKKAYAKLDNFCLINLKKTL
jgi:hypothetical protein